MSKLGKNDKMIKMVHCVPESQAYCSGESCCMMKAVLHLNVQKLVWNKLYSVNSSKPEHLRTYWSSILTLTG